MPGIFISYRRSDNPDATGRIYDRLVSEFGKARVFKDVDSIPLGQDFRGHLNDIVGNCAAVLAIIGPKWSDIRDDAGQRRLEDPDDFVRIELEAALARDVPVVPVLVGNAVLPGTNALPASLASLAFRQSIQLRPDPDFHNDATRLVAALQRILDPNAPMAKPQSGQQHKWISALAAAVALGGIALALFAWKYSRVAPAPEIRTEISTPAADRPQDFALSPDGRQIAFAAKDGDVTRLWLRQLDSEVAKPMPGTDGAADPFWSPNSRSIGFFTTTSIKRVDVEGGLVRVISARQALPGSGGGSWSAQGTILYSEIPGPIMQVSDAGGKASPATKVGETIVLHVGPQFFPDGRRFVYTEVSPVGGQGGIYLGTLDGSPATRLVNADTRGTWLPSGWLLWVQGESLLAQRLDLDQAKLTGEPVYIADSIAREAGTRASTANNGLIAYRRAAPKLLQLQWFDRSGALLGAVGESDSTYQLPRVSPDGRRIAVSRFVSGNQDIWTYDGPRLSRLSIGPGAESAPLWSRDGRSVVYASLGSKGVDIYRKAADGAGEEARIIGPGGLMVPDNFSPDNRYLLYTNIDHTMVNSDLLLQPLDGRGKASAWLQTPFAELGGTFSPDGRWIAYTSNASGKPEVYVRPYFPSDTRGEADNPDVQWLVSAAGGAAPTWRPDGKEIQFLNSQGEMMAAPVTVSGSTLTPGAPVRLFATRISGGGNPESGNREYDVAPDGRFLINTELDARAPSPIVLIQNWNPQAKQTTR